MAPAPFWCTFLPLYLVPPSDWDGSMFRFSNTYMLLTHLSLLAELPWGGGAIRLSPFLVFFIKTVGGGGRGLMPTSMFLTPQRWIAVRVPGLRMHVWGWGCRPCMACFLSAFILGCFMLILMCGNTVMGLVGGRGNVLTF